MKYLKKYEELPTPTPPTKYKAGDYAKIPDESIFKFYPFIKILSNSGEIYNNSRLLNTYNVEYMYIETPTNISILNGTIREDNIERKCTPEEVDEYEIKKASLKFNI